MNPNIKSPNNPETKIPNPDLTQETEKKPEIINGLIIDDDKEGTFAYLLRLNKAIKEEIKELGFIFEHKKSSREAIRDLSEKKPEDWPKIILVDSDLKNDSQEYAKGKNIIKMLKEIIENFDEKDRPIIIGYSGSANYKEELKEADMCFEKNPKNFIQHLKNIKQEYKKKIQKN